MKAVLRDSLRWELRKATRLTMAAIWCRRQERRKEVGTVWLTGWLSQPGEIVDPEQTPQQGGRGDRVTDWTDGVVAWR